MHQLNPADELAETRSELARLKAREAVLRATILKLPPTALIGRWNRIEIETKLQLVFEQSLLPESLRHDPCFRTERQFRIVRCLPLIAKLTPRDGWPIQRESRLAAQ
jgi:hypothetical protein